MGRSGQWYQCVATALAVLAASAVGQGRGHAQRPPLEIHYGFADRARPHCWTPVLIESALDMQFQGEAVIYPEGAAGAEPGEYRTPVTLTSSGADGERERFWLYVRPGAGPFRASAYLDGPGGVQLFDRQAMGGSSKPLSDSATVVLVAYGPSGRPLGLQAAILHRQKLADGREYRPYAHYYDAVPIATGQLPNRAIGYDGIDVLVLLNPRIERDLSEDQVRAIIQFVEEGGRLVFFVNRNWQEVAGSPLAEILPATLGPLAPIADTEPLRRMAGEGAPAIQGELFVPAMVPAGPECRVELACGGRPVILRRAVGMGSVVLVGLASESETLQKWPAAPALEVAIHRLKEQPIPPEDVQMSSFVVGRQPDQFIIPGGRYGSVHFVWAILLMTLGYIVVAGPLLHLVLRSIQRLHWSWPAYMGLSLAVAGLSFAVVSAVRNRDTQCRTLTVVDFPCDGRAMVGRSFHHLRFPDSSLYDVELEARRGAIALRRNTAGFDVMPTTPQRFRHSPTLLAVERLAVKSNQSRHFTSQWRAEASAPVTADIRLWGNTLSGSLIGGNRDIRQAVLVADGTYYEFPKGIKAGQTVSVGTVRRQETSELLKQWARWYLDEATTFGMVAPGNLEDVTAQGISNKVYRDICLASFYERYRRHPVEAARDRFQMLVLGVIGREASVRAMDLTHVLDAGYAVLVGVADLELPDGLIVNGRKARCDAKDHLVVFRQVIPIGGPPGIRGLD